MDNTTDMTAAQTAAYEYEIWLKMHPERALAALEGLTALNWSIYGLPPEQAAALTDLANLLVRARELGALPEQQEQAR